MNVRLLEILKLAVLHTSLIAAFLGTVVSGAHGEPLVLFRDASPAPFTDIAERAPWQKSILKLDEKGDVHIQCGITRLTLAYTPSVDRFKPVEPRSNPQREMAAVINGISLTASLAF